jgi:hypothetical protein
VTLLLVVTRIVSAEPIAVLAPPPGDDARQAVAIGPHGEVYAPDGKGAWTRTQRFSTVDTLVVAGRSGRDVVASGEGAVYQLADNGWSAIRLHQKDKAIMGGGSRAVAAVKKQLYALHLSARGEPEKLALAPATVLAIGAGKSIVIATDRGLARVTGTKVEAIAGAPKQVLKLVGDRWALLATGAHDLRDNKKLAWPAGSKVMAATLGPDEALVAVAARAGKLELFVAAKGVLDRQPVDVTPGGTAVGVAADRAGRIVVALADGRVLVRDRGAWSSTTVTSNLPSDRPGAGPAPSP